MIHPEMQTAAAFLLERLLNSALDGIIVAGLVWALMRFIRRENSGTRFVIWFGALLAIVALPFFSGWSSVGSHLLSTSALHGEIVISSSCALWIFALWAGIAGVSLARLGMGLWRVRKYRSACSEVNLDFAVDEILRDFQFHRRVTLLASDQATVPSAVGFFRPAIVFPAWLLPKLSREEIKLILLHELAHLRRWDDWTNLLQKAIRAVFFFHPAVWWIERHLALEREMACDDMVLAHTATPREYASSLISFAEKLHDARSLALAQALLGRMQQLSPRLKKILNANPSRRAQLGWPAVVVSCAALGILVSAASFAPRVIAFRSESNGARAQATEPVVTAAGHSSNLALTRVAAETVSSHRNPSSRLRAIPASLTSPVSNTALRLNTKPRHRDVGVHVTALQQRSQIEETFVIVRTTQFDASGRAVWTLCVWRVGGDNMTVPILDSAIFMGSI